MTNTLYESAQQWASAGYPVFPLVAGQKTPLTKNGYKDATTELDQISEWWQRWPDANIGIATDGLLVVDVDVKDGTPGLSSLAMLQQNHEVLPSTATQTTASGGLHLIFECDDPDIRNRANLPVDGVAGKTGLDIRGKGGYIVAAPSVINGIAYRCTAVPPVAAPGWLVDLVAHRNQTPPATPTSSPSRAGGDTSARERAYAETALANECTAVATCGKGGRNDALNRAAHSIGTMVGAGWIDYDVAFDSLVAAGKNAGLTDSESRKTAKSGLESGQRSPRGPLPSLPIDTAHHAPTSTTAATTASTTSGAIDMPYKHQPVNIKTLPPAPPLALIKQAIDKDELGDARLFASLYANRIAYDKHTGLWHQWGGHSWVEISEDSLSLLLADHLAAIYSAYAAHITSAILQSTDEDEKAALQLQQKAAFGRVRGLAKRNRINNVLALSRGMFEVDGTLWDANPYLIGVQNGVVDLRNGTLAAGEPTQYIRKVAPTSWAGLDAPAPRWRRFIEELFTDEYEPIRAYIQRLLGYSLIGKVREQILPVFWGTGGNGKGTMLETLVSILGSYAGTLQSEVLMERAQTASAGAPSPHLMKLQGARLVWASETGKNRGFDIQAVKWLTGGDTIVARPPFGKKMVEFKPTHQLVLLTNHKPKADSEDDAFWRRARLIPFVKVFSKLGDDTKAEGGLSDTMAANEASGILAWLVRGSVQYQNEGLNDPECVLAATSEYRQDEDTIGQFIEDCCIEHSAATVASSLLYKTYKQWCDDNGCKPYSTKNLRKILEKRYKCNRNKRGWFWLGIGMIATEYDDELPTSDGVGSVGNATHGCRENNDDTPLPTRSQRGTKNNGVGSVGKMGESPHESTIFFENESLPKNHTLHTPDLNEHSLGEDKTTVYDPTPPYTTLHHPTPNTPIPQRGGGGRQNGSGRYDADKERQAREALADGQFVSAFVSASLISDEARKKTLISEIEHAEATHLAAQGAA